MNLFLLLILSLFLVWLIWLYTDPRPFRARWSNSFLIANGIIFLIVLPQILSYLYFPLPHSMMDTLLVGFGIIVFFIGLSICIWAKLTMRRYWGPPGQHDIGRQNKLLIHGPFAFSRNPIYLGILLLIFGFSMALRSSFFLLPILLYVYFEEQVKREERLLKQHFGEKYEKYRQRVPRFFGYKKISL